MNAAKEPDPLQAHAIDLITRIKRRSGLTVSEIARKCGLSPSTLTRLYPHPKVDYTLSARTIAKLVAVFPHCVDRDTIARSQLPLLQETPTNLAPVAIPVYALDSGVTAGDHDKRLISKFVGADQPAIEQWNDLPAHSITTIPFLTEPEEVNRLIAVYLSGDSMEPRLKAGEIAILDKVKPVPLQADVLVRLDFGKGEIGTIIAQIVKRDAFNMYFEFLRYPATLLVIPRNEILEVLPIVAIVTNSY